MKAKLILKAGADGAPEWLELRTKGIGGSDIAMVYTGKKTHAEWLAVKTGKVVEEIDAGLQKIFDYGHEREPFIAKEFTKYTTEKVRNTGTWANKEHEWKLANPDRLVGSDGILEIKTAGSRTQNAKDWRKGKVPQYAWVQAHWYAHVLGRKTLWFAGEVERELHVLGPYQADENLLAEVAALGAELWGMVQGETVPEETPEDAAKLYPESEPDTVMEVEPWDEAGQLLSEYLELRKQQAELESKVSACANRLKLAMKTTETLISPFGQVTWKTQTRKGAVDMVRLRKETGINPDDYRKNPTITRPFTFKEIA